MCLTGLVLCRFGAKWSQEACGGIRSVLKHYLALDAELADNAVRKLVD
jgi:hypothetical protein